MIIQSLVTVEACASSERTVRRVSKEDNDSLDTDTPDLQSTTSNSPRKTYKRARPFTVLDDFNKYLVRRTANDLRV